MKLSYFTRRVIYVCACFPPLGFCPSTSQSPLDNEDSKHYLILGSFIYFSFYSHPVFSVFNFLFIFIAFPCSENSILQILNIMATSLIFFSWFLYLQILYTLWRHFLSWFSKSLTGCIFSYSVALFGSFGSFVFLSFWFFWQFFLSFSPPSNIFLTLFLEQLAL